MLQLPFGPMCTVYLLSVAPYGHSTPFAAVVHKVHNQAVAVSCIMQVNLLLLLHDEAAFL